LHNILSLCRIIFADACAMVRGLPSLQLSGAVGLSGQRQVTVVTLAAAVAFTCGAFFLIIRASNAAAEDAAFAWDTGLDPNVTAVREALAWIKGQEFGVAPGLQSYAVCRPTDAGFAANFQRLASVAVRALASSSAPRQIVQDLSSWSYGCELGRRWDCFFEMPSPATYETAEKAVASAAALLVQDAETARGLRGGPSAMITVDDMIGNTPAALAGDIPDVWARRGATPRWWWSVVQLYLFRLNEAERSRMKGVLREAGLADGDGGSASCGSRHDVGQCVSVGLHVRLGDRMLHDSSLHGVDGYVDAVRRLDSKLRKDSGGRTRVCCVVAASDEEEAMKSLPKKIEAAIEGKVRVHVLKSAVQRPAVATAQMAHFLSAQEAEVRRAGSQDIITVIEALSETNVLVALCMSQVGRTAAALQYAKGRAVHAPVAMDRDYCLGYPHPFPIMEGWLAPEGI
jgi:hypothetical protein